jgi:hypothetical protein
MISIAKAANPGIDLRAGEKKAAHFKGGLTSIVIAGRSFTYMTTNADVNHCLDAIYQSLRDAGILICNYSGTYLN